MARLEDVANAAGVSKATASRALTRPEMVAPPTRERVLAARDRLGFHSNRAARALTTGRTGLIGLVVPTMENPLFAPLVLAAQQAAETTDLQLIVAVSQYDPDREQRLVERLAREVEGLIMAAPTGPDRALRAVSKNRPIVLVDRAVSTITSVTVDIAAGARAVAEHLIRLGHRHITYVSGPQRTWVDQRRGRALASTLRGAGGTVTRIGPVPPTFAAGVSSADHISPTTTAVVAYSSHVTLGLLHALQAKEARIPTRLSLISADDIDALDVTTPRITAVHLPLTQVGQTAVACLNDMLINHRQPSQHSIPPELIIRGSTAAI